MESDIFFPDLSSETSAVITEIDDDSHIYLPGLCSSSPVHGFSQLLSFDNNSHLDSLEMNKILEPKLDQTDV